MVHAMEGTLHGFKTKNQCYYDQDEAITIPPPLISDSSYSSSDESIDEPNLLQLQSQSQQQQTPKKRSIRNNFLFRSNSKKSQDKSYQSSKQINSLNEPHQLQPNPTRTTSLLSC